MIINIKNVGSIINGVIDVQENSLNIKYGYNGIGKTTISNAIKAYLEHGELSNEFKTFGSDKNPEIKIKDTQKRDLIIFNQDYCDNFLFKDDIANNSFELIVDSKEYEALTSQVNEYFSDLLNSLKNPTLNKIKKELISFKDSIKFNKKDKRGNLNLNATCKASIGKKITNIKEILTDDAKDYCEYLEMNNCNEWLEWFKKAVFEINEKNLKKCPLCNKDLDVNFKTKANSVINAVETKQLKAKIENSANTNSILNYLNNDMKEEFSSYIFNNSDYSQENLINLEAIHNLVSLEIEKIEFLENLNINRLKELYDSKRIREEIINKKLDADSFYCNLKDDEKETINNINIAINSIDEQISIIEKVMNKLSKNINDAIKTNKEYVDKFLQISGIPYTFVTIEDNDNYKSILKPINSDEIINEKSLSYGEKNAISLILFSLEAKNKDFIILDDPVSSFDNHKKFAILYYLFGKEEAVLTDKTTILFTHDFEIITNLLYKQEFKKCCINCNYIYNKNGNLYESKINTGKIMNVNKKWEKNSRREDVNPLIRIICLRKYFEMNNEYGKNSSEWNVLSSLEHNQTIPSRKENGEYVELSEDKITESNSIIRGFISDFNYDIYREKIHKLSELKTWYKNSKSDIDKLSIIRIIIMDEKIIEDNDENKAFLDFVTETYHIENNELVALDDEKFEIIPSYIMNKCDDIISKI